MPTRNEIARTSWGYGLCGFTRDDVSRCPACKAKGEPVRDFAVIAEYAAVYGDQPFTAYSCHHCGAQWSIYPEKSGK